MSFAYEIGEHGYSQLTVYCYKLCLEVKSRLHCIHKPLYMSSKVVVSNLGGEGGMCPVFPTPGSVPDVVIILTAPLNKCSFTTRSQAMVIPLRLCEDTS